MLVFVCICCWSLWMVGMPENCIFRIQVVSFTIIIIIIVILLNFIHVLLHTMDWIQCCLYSYKNATKSPSEACNVQNTLIWVTIFHWNSHTPSEQLNVLREKDIWNPYTNTYTLVLHRTCTLCDDNGHKATFTCNMSTFKVNWIEAIAQMSTKKSEWEREMAENRNKMELKKKRWL